MIRVRYAVNTQADATFRGAIEQLTKRFKLKVVDVLQNPPENWQAEQFDYVEPAGSDRSENQDMSQNERVSGRFNMYAGSYKEAKKGGHRCHEIHNTSVVSASVL